MMTAPNRTANAAPSRTVGWFVARGPDDSPPGFGKVLLELTGVVDGGAPSMRPAPDKSSTMPRRRQAIGPNTQRRYPKATHVSLNADASHLNQLLLPRTV
jgi:hypothetical protein